MRVLKILCVPFMAVFELGLLAVCAVLACRWPRLAEPLINWAVRLPQLGWYLNGRNEPKGDHFFGGHNTH